MEKQFFKGLLFVILTSPAALVYATDYTAGLNMTVDATHNDNLRLVESDKTAVSEYEATPTLTFSANTETTQLKLDSSFSFKRFDKSEFDSNDQNLNLNIAHQFERSTLSLNAKLINNSTITSELLTTGRIGNSAQRAEHYELTPTWSYSLNENNLLQLSATYATQHYHSDEYIGYDTEEGEIDWIHIINERLKWVTSATYSNYQSDDIGTFQIPIVGIFNYQAGQIGTQSYSTRTKSTGLQIGFDYQLTEQSTLSARLGRSRNDTTYPVKDPDNVCSNPNYLILAQSPYSQYVGGICGSLPKDTEPQSTDELDWSWQNERQNIALTASQSTQPTGNGYTVNATQVNSNWSYNLTELDRISTILTLVRNRASGSTTLLPSAANPDRDYASATLQYRRQLDQQWFVTTSYQFNYQKYTQTDYQADSHAVSLGIVYQPTQWHWAR